MPGIIVRDLPPALHTRLKQEALRHHRSMAKEVIVILEETLAGGDRTNLSYPAPVKLSHPLTDAFLNKAKRWGRA